MFGNCMQTVKLLNRYFLKMSILSDPSQVGSDMSDFKAMHLVLVRSPLLNSCTALLSIMKARFLNRKVEKTTAKCY